MKKFISNITGSQFAKNVTLLTSGTIIVQAISTLISPVLSRLYNPDNYGLFAVFASIISILTIVGSFRYELAILLPEKDSDSKMLVKLSVYISIIFSVLIFFITVIFNKQIAELFGNSDLSIFIYFIAPVMLLTCLSQIFTYWFNRNKNYKAIAGLRIYQSSFNSGFSLAFGFLKFNSFGLIVSFILSQMLASVYLFKKTAIRISRISFNLPELKSIARKYIEFPKYNLLSALLDTVSLNSIILLLNYFFTESATGSYSFALRILSIPGVVIGASIGQVFFQKISEAYNNSQSILSVIFKTWKVLFLISLLPTVILFFFGQEIFTFIFGNNWSQAGVISSYLCLLTFFTFISSPTSSAMIVLKKQKAILLLNVVAFIYRPLALLWGYKTNSFLNGIILYVILEMIQIIVYNIYLLKGAREADERIKEQSLI